MNFFIRLLGRFFGKGLNKNVEICNDVVAQNIALYLAKKFIPRFGEDTGCALAAAVTNELFGRPPTNEKGRQFLEEKRELVISHLKELKNEPRICEILKIVVSTRANVAYGTCKVTPEIIQQTVKLKEIGILSSDKKVKLLTAPEELIEKVKEFELWVINQN